MNYQPILDLCTSEVKRLLPGGGAQEISSCVTKYVTMRYSKIIKHVVMYSDTYTGQNKNRKFSLYLMELAAQ